MSMFKTLFFLNEMDKNEQNAKKISNQNNEIFDKNTEIGKLKKQLKDTEEKLAKAKQANDVPEWKVRELYKQQSLNKELEQQVNYYKSLLSKPMLEIANKNKKFKKTYEKQQAVLTEFIIKNKAMKELAQKYGVILEKTDEDLAQDLDIAKEKIMNGESDFGNNVSEEEFNNLNKLKEHEQEEKNMEQELNEQKRKNSESIQRIIDMYKNK